MDKPVSRVLFFDFTRNSYHLSRTLVTQSLQRPTHTSVSNESKPKRAASDLVPIWSFSP